MRRGGHAGRGVIYLFLAACLLFSTEGVGDEGCLSLPSLIEQALKDNPGIAASSSSVEAAKARVPQAGTLPDPMLEIGLMSVPVDTFQLNQESMTQLTVGVSQMLPYPGKLNNLSQAARAGSRAAEYRDLAVKQQTVALVRSTYYDLVFVDQALAITGQNKDLMEQLSRIALAQYEVGMGAQPDALKAQVESLRVDDDWIMYEQQRARQGAELIRLINADPRKPVAGTRPCDRLPPLPDRDQLFSAARQNNPMLLAERAMADQAQKEQALALLSWKPDITVGVNYGIRQELESVGPTMDNPDLISAEVGIPIPLWKRDKQDQEVVEKQAEQRAAERTASEFETRLIAQVDQARAEAEATCRQIALLETGIIPEARLALESAGAGYRAGKVDFMTWLNNQATLYQLEIRLAQLKARYLMTLAELDMLTGKPIDAILKEVES